MASQLHLQQKVTALKLKIIDPSKCNPRISLYQQILRNWQTTADRQNHKFNLGNGQSFTDPILAADFLLHREYADTALFDSNHHEPVFIPPVFQSIQFAKKDSTVHTLDYNVNKTKLRKSLDNMKQHSPNHWFAGQLQKFYDLQENNTGDEINAKEFNSWILNVKIMHLVIEELGRDKVSLPVTTTDNKTFVQASLQELASKSPGSSLEAVLKKVRVFFVRIKTRIT